MKWDDLTARFGRHETYDYQRQRRYQRESVEKHPRYGQIVAMRRSGTAYLYGSDFSHQHFVTIQISTSELMRGLSRDWPHARDRLIEVSLSEAQWATFVSSMNVGDGVQCTIEWKAGEGYLPEIDAAPDRHKQFAKESSEKIVDAAATLEEIIAEVEREGRMGKTKLLSMLRRVRGDIGEGSDWVAQSFSEHMEKTVEKAKIEINAYAQNLLVRTGIAALGDGTESPLLLESGPKESE